MTVNESSSGTALVATILYRRFLKCRAQGNHNPNGAHCDRCGLDGEGTDANQETPILVH